MTEKLKQAIDRLIWTVRMFRRDCRYPEWRTLRHFRWIWWYSSFGFYPGYGGPDGYDVWEELFDDQPYDPYWEQG